jgi:hypothetical protein
LLRVVGGDAVSLEAVAALPNPEERTIVGETGRYRLTWWRIERKWTCNGDE